MMRYLLPLILASCATSATLPPVRFANAPAAWAVNDRRNIAKPDEITFVRYLYNFDGQFYRRLARTLELPRPQRALGINALDEVPNSTWFTNRIGVRDISPEEIAAAPGGVGSPEAHTPWTIVSSKVGGLSVGFIVKDARGEKFLIKFDPLGRPEAETGTHVIMARLLWAFGLNVTEDYVTYVRPEDLVLSPDAVVKDVFGNKRPLDHAELAKRLALIQTEPDGTIRALASHWLAGKPLGGHTFEGTRPDDPNDRIPHELRRDLRGLYALFSWVDHNDIHGANVLDMWVTDPVDPACHYVKHYWLDFGTGLGFAAAKDNEPRFGYEHYVDFPAIARSLLTLGTAGRAWVDREEVGLRGLGLYEVDHYDPGTWVSSSPAYVPIYVADRIDKFWASKILIRFTREQIRAVVDSARFSDPRTSVWLTEALIARQRKTARYWFARTNPLDEIIFDGDRLCWKDLAIAHAFTPARGTTYAVRAFDRAGHQRGSVEVTAGDSGVTCASTSLAGGDDYTIFKIDTKRAAFAGSTHAHVARDPRSQVPRVIGIWRP